MDFQLEPSSFRDPSGFVFYQNGKPHRQVNRIFESEFKQLHESGLYDALVSKKLLISHEVCDASALRGDGALTILKPEVIPFISYPYEWCFSQFKDAALLTLRIQNLSLKHGMSLKDASAYNIQFLEGKPVFIDILSFEEYMEGKPWSAYRQFCQHFLAPLSLMAYKRIELGQLFKNFIDGIPLDVASALLPMHTRMIPSLLMHVHLHSRVQRRFQDNRLQDVSSKGRERYSGKVSRNAIQGIIDSLESAVRKCIWKPDKTVWRDYYQETNYADESFEFKKQSVAELLGRCGPKTVWDLGANTGIFSKIATDMGIQTISADVDPAAVELNYIESRKRNDCNILPLILDLVNPSGGIGWENRERTGFFERGKPDVVMALALLHHLAIGNNIPLNKLAVFFESIAPKLIIEFVPKSDSQVKRLLQCREDIFPAYTPENFEKIFGDLFSIEQRIGITSSDRALYLLTRKKD